MAGEDRYLQLAGILTDYFVATPVEALAIPLGTDLPKAELTEQGQIIDRFTRAIAEGNF